MPDQPDDARKRPQRGVFPPFFAPRNGRGESTPESTPTPPGGSWRRVSRLFTPPEVARQRRTPAAPQAPYTPPVAPVEPVPPEAPVPPTMEASEDVVQPSFEEPEAVVSPALPEAVVSPSPPELPEEQPFDSALPIELEQAAADVLGRFDPMAFDDGADSFAVESLEPEPISLASSDVLRMDVAVDSAMDAAPDSLEDVAPTGFADASEYDFPPGMDHDVVESIESYLAGDDAAVVDHTRGLESASRSDDATLVEGAIPDEMLRQEADHAHDGHARLRYEGSFADETALYADETALHASDAVAAGGALEEQPTEVDPWAGAELPEPAFGSIGWPSSEIAALAGGQSVDNVDEMGAALAWSDAESPTSEHGSPAPEANGSDVPSDDALSAVVHELRDSSSAWITDANVADDDDLSARARFYGGGERSTSFPSDADGPSDPDAAPEASSYAGKLAAVEAAGSAPIAGGEAANDAVSDALGDAVSVGADDDAGAAIADALARVAARIRAGEVDLPPEVVGASDESALAAALAALLRGPRR